MRYDNLIMPYRAQAAARILKQYCNQTGCVYCRFRDKEKEVCALKVAPRMYPEEFLHE